ncbi:MAG: hypothetical protein ACREXT_15345 [Gammaproteobacteria bacterium]
MNETILALIAGYVLLAALLVALCLYTRFSGWIKTAAILATGMFFFLTYGALRDVLGWPAYSALPERFMLLASWITEPDKIAGTGGAIEVWAVTVRDDGPAAKPRAYTLAYDEELHQALDEANRQIRNGMIQIGHAERRERDAGLTKSARFADVRQRLEFSNLPDPELPEK